MDKLKNKIQKHIDEMEVDEPNAATWNCIKNDLDFERMDSLKKHIAVNKNELKIEVPRTGTWKEISSSVSIKKHPSAQGLKRNLTYLSAACALTLLGLAIFRYTNDTKSANDISRKPSIAIKSPAIDTVNLKLTGKETVVTASLRDNHFYKITKRKSTAISKTVQKQKNELLPPELLQIEKDYDKLIAGQIKYTKELAIYGESPSYFQEFMNDFKLLEEQEKELRKSIAQIGLQQNSIDDLTTIYQQKLTILKKLQTEINKTSTRNKNITDTIPTYLTL